MSRKTIVTVTSDLSGEPDARPVTVSWQGSTYEIDLTDSEVDALAAMMAPYVTSGRRITGSAGKSVRAVGPARTGTTAARRRELEVVRKWASERGLKVPPRGRIPRAIMDQYERESVVAA